MRRGAGGARAFAAAFALALTACSVPGTKAGAGQPPTVLRLATVKNPSDPNARDVTFFADRVSALSRGTVQVEVDSAIVPWTPLAEAQVTTMARTGATDLAVAPTRVFDTLGLNEFQALQTPMLIDTPELAGAVATSDIAADLLARLDDDGLVGLGLAYEELRRPVALNGAVTRAADFEGRKVQTQTSNLTDQALRALGASPENSVSRVDDRGVEYPIVETEFLVAISDFPRGTATANVVLFPKWDVVLANPAAFGRLTSAQRDALRQAATETAAAMVQTTADEQRLAATFCAGGGQLVLVPDPELERIRSRLEPVADRLREEPGTSSTIRSIETLKAQHPGPRFTVPLECLPPTGDAARLPSAPAAPTP